MNQSTINQVISSIFILFSCSQNEIDRFHLPLEIDTLHIQTPQVEPVHNSKIISLLDGDCYFCINQILWWNRIKKERILSDRNDIGIYLFAYSVNKNAFLNMLNTEVKPQVSILFDSEFKLLELNENLELDDVLVVDEHNRIIRKFKYGTSNLEEYLLDL